MKTVLKDIIINTLIIWITSQVINGFVINGGFDVLLLGGVVLTLMNFLVKPVLSLLTLPLNIVTLGLFSWVLNVIIIYLLTVVVSQIVITSYTFPGINIWGISIAKLTLPAFQTTIVVAFAISFFASMFNWVFRK